MRHLPFAKKPVPRVRHRRRLATASVAVALLGLIMSAATTNAQPEPVAEPTDLAGVLSELPDDAQTLLAEVAGGDVGVPLTLITGDQVVVGLDDEGAPTVQNIVAATRADGYQPVFHTVRHDDQVYVIPSDVLPLVEQDVLDWALFDLTELAEHAAAGTVGEVPVIVTYDNAPAARQAPHDIAGAKAERRFDSIHAVALTLDGDGTWWRQVRDTAEAVPGKAGVAAAGPLAGVEKVWLDELAEIHLDESVPQIGAPAAWDVGFDGSGVTVAVLDTGIDADHADVAGKILDAVDFTDNPDGAADGHGHGTHVAATIAGTGDAADGLRPGVAPGADLLVGKVCSDDGQCAMSQVIAGMEWAAAAGARVVNMSLGGDATDGTDLESMVLNELSARYDTLFVVAAGNDGPGSYSVSTPASADAALSVAAVDKSDRMAWFSSRGPRVGDGALKPEIAAPGVGIVAARAAGTEMGTVVDDDYTAADGTSMAAPHVAGGAAIVAQQHPELSSRQLKALLMGTATDLGHDIYAQGSGRLDLSRAVDATVFAGGPVAFGTLPFPQQPATTQAQFVNVADEPITLSLAGEFTDGAGNPAPTGLFTVETDEVTVPAHGEVTVDVTADGTVLTDGGLYGRYTGRLTAYDDSGAERADAFVSAFLDEQRFPVEIDVVGADPSASYGRVLMVPMDDQTHLHNGPIVVGSGSEVSTEVFDGTYAISTSVSWTVDGVQQTALLVAPEVVVTDETTVTLDVADTQRFDVDFPQPLDVYSANVDVTRTSATGDWGLTVSLTTDYSGLGPDMIEPNWWLLPTDTVNEGTLTAATGVVWIPEVTTLRALGGGRSFDLNPRYVQADVSTDGSIQVWPEGEGVAARSLVQPVPRLLSGRPLSVVHAGTGTADELAAADVAGKLVLLTMSDVCTSFTCPYDELHSRVEAAAELGAVGVLIAGPDGHVYLPDPPAELYQCVLGPDSCPPAPPYSSPIPVLSIPAGEASMLVDRLAANRNVRIDVGGDGTVSEAYAVPYVDDHVPAMPYRLDPKTLHRTTHRIHDSAPGETKIFEWTRVFEGDEQGVVRMRAPRVATPAVFALHVPQPPAGARDQFHVGLQNFTAPNAAALTEPEINTNIAMAPGERRLANLSGDESTYSWNTGPQVPGASAATVDAVDGTVTPGTCSGCREGDTFWPTIHLTTSSGDPTTATAGVENDTGAGVWMLNANGCEHCAITLSDAGGETLTRTVIPLTFDTDTAPILDVPADESSGVWLHDRWRDSTDMEVAR